MLYLEVKALHIFLVASWFAGLWLWLVVGITGPWLHAKLVLVVGLVGYNHYCNRLLREFRNGANTRSHVWFRWFNEVPAVVLLVVCFLVILKPF
jgi:putative membrane protein